MVIVAVLCCDDIEFISGNIQLINNAIKYIQNSMQLAGQIQGMINIYTYVMFCICMVVASYVPSLQLAQVTN